MRCGGIVLCGGQSSRMGRPKAWLPFGGELMLARVVRLLREAVEPVVVVAAPGQDVPPLPREVEVIRDEDEGKGPLAGLCAGLIALEGACDAVYLSACDVPLLRPAFVRRVLGAPREEPLPPTPSPKKGGRVEDAKPQAASEGAAPAAPPLSPPPFLGEGAGGRGSSLAAVPRVGGFFHPLAAAYRVGVLPVVRDMLAAGELRMTDLFGLIPTHAIEPQELTDADPELDSLRNLNTPAEYEAALRRLSSDP